MPSETLTFRARSTRALRRVLPWVLALAVATCTDDQNGPSRGGTGYFSFRPVYGISNSLSQFGVVADSVRVLLTRPVDQLVLDTTVFFSPDSAQLRLALPVHLESSPETLSAVIEISAGGVLLFVDSVDVQVVDGPPSAASIPTVILDYVGPGQNVAAITLAPGDTTIVLGDTLFFTSTAVDSSAVPVTNYYVAWKTSDTAVAKINAQGRLIAPLVRGTVRVIGYTPTGIADTTVVTFAPVPTQILPDSGLAQSGLAGDSLGTLFVARVVGADALGISGIDVRFTAVTAGGAVRDTLLTTDLNGRVRTRGVLGTGAGAYSWSATVVGTAITTTFGATANPGTASAIAIQGGNLQSDSAGRVLALPFTVRVADAFNNPVTGAKVYWTRTVGTGTVALDSSFTNGTGLATAGYTLGDVGTDSVTATLAGTSAFVAFQATAINGLPATVVKNFGDAQTDTVGRQLTDSFVVIVRSATTRPVVGTPVVWTVLRGGSTSDDTVFTDAAGRAAVVYTLGTVTGPDSVRAQAGAATTTFTATTLTGAATSLAIVSGDAQTDTAGLVLPLPFVVHATDAFGNAVAGTDILFARIAGTGTLADDTVTTDGLGNASVGYTLGSAGTDSVTATLLCACSSVTFTATAISSAPAAILTIAGDSQTIVVGTESTDTITVAVRDGSNNPVAGVNVDWSVLPAVGGFTPLNPGGAMRSISDSLGIARAVITAGTLAQTVRVEAQVGSLIDSIYTFQVAAAPSVIAIGSGDAQSDTVGNAIPLPFVAHVTDAFNNPVSGAMVLFTRIAGSGTLFADSVATNASGDAAVGYLFGLVPGVDTIRATLSGTAAFVDFEATALAALPASIVSRSGSGQTAAVTVPLTDSIEVEVLSADDDPIVNGAVVWTNVLGGLVLSADTTYTDTLGRTYIHVTAGTSAGTYDVYARAIGLADSTAFSVNVLAGPASLISIQSGDGQTDTTTVALPAPFVAAVTDAYGNPVLGAAVLWQVQVGSGNADDDTTFTDLAGQTQVNYTLGTVPGVDSVRASLVGTSAFVDFSATTVSGAAGFLLKILGDAQTDTVLATLADSLVVELRDGANTPIPGTWIYWVAGGTTLSADSTLTDANGRAAVQATFDDIAIPVSVIVFNADTTVATGFALTATAGTPTQITAVGGLGQTAEAGTALPIDFGAFVQDAHGNPAPGASVTWTNIAGFAAAGLPDTTLADSTGVAYLTSPMLGAIAGEDSLEAQILGQPATATFTATATTGAASALQYVSGTGQSQTVGTMLATQFNVQALDAGSNPVGGAWVHWTVIAGNGSFPADSSLTDGSGVAKITLTLGTIAGVDSAVATLAGSADTVTFYAVATAGTPTTILPISGDAQAGAIGSTLPLPFVVAIQDSFGNPIAGASVEFIVAGGTGLHVLNGNPSTDAAGQASSDSVLLDGPAGSYATAAFLSSDPSITMDFSTVVLPIGTSKQWTGANGNSWGDPGNWSPSGLPSGSDNVYVPASALNQPLLDVSRTIGGLAIEAGADVNIQGNILTLNGDLAADGTISRTSGHTILAATAGNARGNLGAIEVTGDITLVGTATLTDNTQITSGSLVVGGQTLTLTGSLDVTGTGAFVMSNAADSVEIAGAATFNGSTAIGNLTNGVLTLRGDLSVTQGFRATSTHRTIIAGTSPQQVSMTAPSLSGDRFQEVEFRNPVGMVLASDIAAAGTVRVEATVFGNTRTLFLGGSLIDTGSVSWNVSLLDLTGSPAVLPDTLSGALYVNGGSTSLPASVVVTSDVQVAAGTLMVNGHTLKVLGSLNIVGSGEFRMNDGADTVEVSGFTGFNGSANAGLLTAGELILHGDLQSLSALATFQSTGTHRTTFAGVAPQTINLNAAQIGGTQFREVVFANGAGVDLINGIAVAGNAILTAGNLRGEGYSAILGGDLIVSADSAWAPEITEFAGAPTAFPDTFARNLAITGSFALPHDVTVLGNLDQSFNGVLDLSGRTLTIDSAMSVSGNAEVRMQNSTDVLEVRGDVTWGGSTNTGLLTAGSALFLGDFTGTGTAPVYQASGTHTTIFGGSTPQTVSFSYPELGGDQFWDVSFNNAAGVTFSSDFAVGGQVNVAAGTVTSPGTATVDGSVSGFAGFDWQVELTRFTGTVAVVPDNFPRSVEFANGFTMAQPFNVGGALLVSGGTFNPNGWSLTVDSVLTVSNTAAFLMQNATDSVDVGGTATWDGSTTPGLLTAGVLVLRGDVNVPNSSTFQPSGSHKSVLAPATGQVVTFAFPGYTDGRFHNLELAGTGTITLDNTVYVASTLTTAPGAGVTVAGSNLRQIQTRELAINGVTFDSVQVVARGTQLPSLDNVTFFRQDPTGIALQVVTGGEALPKAWTNIAFTGSYTTGKMLQVIDSAVDALPSIVRMMNSFPLNGEAFESEIGTELPSIDWTRLVFADPIQDGVGGGLLPTFRVAVLDAAGDTLTSYSNSVGLAIGTNPSGGTLGGTTVVAASGGIASFGDLTIDLAGLGFTITAGTTDLPLITSAPFNITVPLPAGFDMQWVGNLSNDWYDPANWSTGTLPDSTTNVYLSGLTTNGTLISAESVFVKRLRVDPGATLEFGFQAKLIADSSVEFGGTLVGGSNFVLRGSGDITGDLGSYVKVDGDYAVAGTAAVFQMDVFGDLTLDADTLNVSASFQVAYPAELHMTDPNTLVYVGVNAAIAGAQNSTTMADGVLRLGGDLTSYGSGGPQGFTPTGNQVTEFVGTGVQNVDFFIPDTLTGSSFNHVRINGTGTVNLQDHVDIRGQLDLVQGTLSGDPGMGVTAHQGITVASGAFLTLQDVISGGTITTAVGSSYSVPTTTYYGAGPVLVNAVPYDTLILQTGGTAAGDFGITGDLRISGIGAGLDLNGHTVGVDGNVDISNGANLTMQNAADFLSVAGSFFTNGDSTTGLLTDGLLQIGGSFRQAADGSGESFRASGNHATRFTGGLGARQITFDSPSTSPTDLGGSHFAALFLPDGIDSLGGRVPAAVSITVGGSVTYDTTGGGYALASYGPLNIQASSDSVHVQTLEVWGSLNRAGTGLYQVGLTRLWGGGGGLPALPYTDLSIANSVYALVGDLTLPGNLDVGIYCSEVCTSSGGDLQVNGHDLIIGGSLSVMGLGQLQMAAGDSVDVAGDITWRTSPSAGNLTGGTLVARGMFNTVGASAFQPDAAHHTVMLAAGAEDIYPTTDSWFGKLTLLDGAPRRVRSSQPLVVLDSLILGSATSGLNDTLGFGSGNIVAQGPVVTVVGSSIFMDGSVRFDHDDLFITGDYSAVTTIFGGSTQPIPALAYNDIQVVGTASLTGALDIGNGQFSVDGSAGAADLDLAGQLLQVGDFSTAGNATLTSTTVGSELVVRGGATFNGSDETGRLTEGGITFKGSFTQDSLASLSSYVSGGNHTTVFADSSFGGAQVVLNSMAAGNSRFNHVSVYGRGVLFFGTAWIDGDVNVLDPLVDSVAGPSARLGASLNATGNRWKVDTTTLAGIDPDLPDSIDGNVLFLASDSLEQGLVVHGHLTIFDTLVPNPGSILKVDSLFAATGNGLLVMTQPSQRVEIEGNAFFDGATSTGQMTAGTLKINGGLFRGLTNPLAFDATGNHVVYVDSISDGSVINFDGPGGGLQNLQIGSVGLTLNSDLLVRGDLYHDGESPDPINGGNHLLTVYGLVEQQSIFDNTRVAIPEQNTLFDVTFQNMDGTADQLTVFGDGSPEPLQLGTIRFTTTPTTGNLLHLVDTLADGDSLFVEMMSTTPAQGGSYTAITGEARASWPQLVLQAFPVSIDSALAFTITVGIMNPDSSAGNTSLGNATIALEANPLGNTLGGTLNIPFGGVSASFSDLSLLLPGIGTSFRISIDGRPTDTLVTPTLQIINPAPPGAIVFTGATSTDWSDGSNWSTLSVPGPIEDVFIPGGNSVFIPPASTYVINTLVLGTGADLDLGAASTLTANGDVSAGQTITGPGTLILGGAVRTVTGSIASPTMIQGQITAVGNVTFGSDLTVDGAGAALNVGGAKVTVTGIFSTANFGILTMDGPTDTLIADEMAFNGGSTIGTLTAGTLILTGTDFSQAGASPSAYQPSGTHTTVLEDGGDNTNVFFNDPDSSYFQRLAVNTPNAALLSTPTGHLRIFGDLTLDADGALTGDTLRVDGVLTMGASSNLSLGQVALGTTPVLAGNYNVVTTWYFGNGITIPAAPVVYPRLYVDNAATLGPNVSASYTLITGNGYIDVAGETFLVDTLETSSNGALVMDAAEDTVVVGNAALFLGASEGGSLTDGVLRLFGDLYSPAGKLTATGAHIIEFAGIGPHTAQLSPNIGCDGPCAPPNSLAHVKVLGTTLSLLDPQDVGLYLDTLTLTGGDLQGSGAQIAVNGAVLADAASTIVLGDLRSFGAGGIQATGATYNVTTTEFLANGQVISRLPYQQLNVGGAGTVALGDSIFATGMQVVVGGVVNMAGHVLTVTGDLMVNGPSHILMQDPLDTLVVTGNLYLRADSTEGDFTAGAIRAFNLRQEFTPLGFVETGSHRVIPVAGGLIQMDNAGPATSRLKTIDFSPAGDAVTVQGLWVTDTLILNDGGTAIQAADGYPFAVMGALVFDAGMIDANRMALGGTLAYTAGTYNIDTTAFAGAGQTIPVNVPYNDIEVLYNAALEGDLSLPDRVFTVLNSGSLDLNGFNLTMGGLGSNARFETQGFGVLVMDDAADTLTVTTARFGGGDETGLLTAGVLQVGNFQQVNGAGTINTFVASGTHLTEFINIGFTPEGGYNLQLGPDAADTASHFNALSFLGTSGVDLSMNVYAAGAVLIDNTLDGQFYALTAAGAITIGSAADVTLDTLRVLSTLSVDPSAGYTVNNTVFGPAAAPIPSGAVFNSTVVIEGSQTLTSPLTVGGELYIRGSGVLTPNDQKVTSANGLYLLDNARLVMAAADTVDVGTASFDGAASGADLAGGILQIRNGLSSGNATSSQSFAPTGMVTEFYGGGTANISIAVSSPSNSFIDTLRVIGGTTIAPTDYFLVMGPTVIKDGSVLSGNSSSSGLEFRGNVSVLDTSSVVSTGFATIFFSDTLTMATPGNYSVVQTNFYNTNGIPDLPYTYLLIGDGVHDTLTHNLSASAQMIIGGNAPGQQELVLNGHTVTAGVLDISGYGRVVMTHPNDSLISVGNLTFSGDDESGRLTAGTIRVGSDLFQNGAFSPRSLRTDGVRVEFHGPTSHLVSFTNPDTLASYLGNVAILPGSNVFPNSALTFKGRVDVSSGGQLILGAFGALASDFYGPVTVASSGALSNADFGIVTFHDTLLVDPAATYNVVNTAFRDIDTIPDITYQNLYLFNGTDAVLGNNLTTTGSLSVDAPTGSASLTLNGRSVIVGGQFTMNGNATLVMTNAADQLIVTQNANFGGGNESGLLTAGTLQIGGNFTQTGTTSDRAFRSTGTQVRFTDAGTQQVAFANPDSSWFADVADQLFGTPTLNLNITGRMKATGTVGAYGTIISGDTLEVGTLSAGPGTGTVALARVRAGAITGSFGTYVVPTTEFVGVGPIASLPYDTLVVSGNNFMAPGFTNATWVKVFGTFNVPSGATLQAVRLVTVAGGSGQLWMTGGSVVADSLFSTVAGGTLRNDAGGVSARDASFGGGNTTGLLTGGALNVKGNFEQVGFGTFSFDADSTFTVAINGGGQHTISIADPASSKFGTLLLEGSAPGTDTTTFPLGSITAHRLSTNNTPTIIGAVGGSQLDVATLGVSGLADSGVRINQSSTSPQPLTFDDVTFRGFTATDVQLSISHPGTGILDPTQFAGIDFDDAANPDQASGFFVRATDSDGITTFLNLQIYGPDSGIGATLTALLSGALVGWFPPS
jgi:hypothetical protein